MSDIELSDEAVEYVQLALELSFCIEQELAELRGKAQPSAQDDGYELHSDSER